MLNRDSFNRGFTVLKFRFDDFGTFQSLSLGFTFGTTTKSGLSHRIPVNASSTATALGSTSTASTAG